MARLARMVSICKRIEMNCFRDVALIQIKISEEKYRILIDKGVAHLFDGHQISLNKFEKWIKGKLKR